LFKGDPKLEACLVDNAAHITKGAAGNHVGKIQMALAQIDNLVIAQGELSAQTYGRSTAAAVLDFKTRRSIINKAYQVQPDDIVGKRTIDALDTELLGLETGVVEKAYATIPEALNKVRNARARLLLVRAGSFLPNPFGNQKEQAIAEWNFKISRAPDQTVQVDKILGIYDRMVEAFFKASHFRKLFLFSKRHPTSPGAPAYTTLGGYFYGMSDKDERNEYRNAIYVTPQFANKVFAASIIIHEMAHYCGGKYLSPETIEHRASPRPPPRGRRLEDGWHDYAGMTANEAYRNAQSYQAYCDPETLGKPPD
jgi:hypothetical protein